MNKKKSDEIALRDYIGSSCEIKNLNDEIIAVGVTGKIGDEELLIYNGQDKLPPVVFNTVVRLRLSGGEFPPYFGMGRVYLSTPDFIKVVEFRDVQSFERRLAFRVPVNMEGMVHIIRKLEEGEEVQPAFAVRLRNLSLSGAFLVTDHILLPTDKLELEFTAGYDVYRMNCIMCRNEEMGSKRGYGCSFQSLHPQMGNKLCALLFRLQGEQIRRAKGHG